MKKAYMMGGMEWWLALGISAPRAGTVQPKVGERHLERIPGQPRLR
jgi:hypothetical protein